MFHNDKHFETTTMSWNGTYIYIDVLKKEINFKTLVLYANKIIITYDQVENSFQEKVN